MEVRLADGLFGGRIALGDEIGRGAMGVVYQAVLDNRPVAIKVLHPHLTSDLAVVGRFVREHQALSRIDHPNVVKVIDMIIDDPRLGIVMEHLDHPDLGKVIGTGGVDPQRALQLAAGIASGVAAIHEARVVHRDLKPANVIVARRATLDDTGVEQVTEIPKIADFGVSRLVGQSIVNPTTTMGTPLYMSPEAAGGGAPVGRPADVYSLGVILYELLTGRPPYTAEEPIAIAVAHVNSPVPIVGGIPDQLSELLQAMMAKIPDHRPDAASVERILSSLAPHISTTLRPTVLNADALDPNVAMAGTKTRSAETVLIPSSPLGSTDDAFAGGGFFADQTIAGARPTGRPNALLEAPPAGDPWRGTGVDHPILTEDSVPQMSRTGLSPPQRPPDSRDLQPPPPSSILSRSPSPSYADDFGRNGGHQRNLPVTTASSVERRWQRRLVPLALLLLIPLVWIGWTQTRGASDNVDLETTNVAFSFLPRVGSNGLITTRRWELTTNQAGQAVIKAEVLISNTSDEAVTATHYEAFPGAVDADYLIDTFNPTPDEVVRDPGVAVFEMGELPPRARFTITYEMLAPAGVDSVEALQGLAEDQAEVETSYVESLPSQAAQEAMDTEGELTDLALSPTTLDLQVGQITTARLRGSLSDGTEVDPAALAAAVWIIEDPDIAELTATNAIRGLKDGDTRLIVSIGDIEVSIDVVVRAVDDEVAATTSTTSSTTTTTSSTTTTAESTTTTTEATTTSSTAPTTSVTTATTTPVEPDLTMSGLGVEISTDGSFRITFSTNLCTIANYSGAGQSYVTPGWPEVGELCWQNHGQSFTAVESGSYLITVKARSAGGQQAERTTTVVIDKPDPGEDPLVMSPLSVTVNEDGSFRITFTTNLCTIANYSGAGQSYVTPGWPDVGELCWQNHGQSFTAVEPGSYQIVVRTRSAGGQTARRTTVVEITD